jgi:undecaprenyldiphospho-muramoylpentapeptide beta-N-acetylglucosaminyltransferase
LRLLVSAGGTGGGVYPALAVLAALGEKADVLWVGGEGGMEASLVRRSDVRFTAVPAAGVHGVGLRVLPGNIWRLLRGVFAARNVIKDYRPDVIFFTGGYVAIPVALAGSGIPKAVYVPDIEPGLALRVVSRMAAKVMVTSDRARDFYPRRKDVVVTGYPTRPEFLEHVSKEGPGLDLDSGQPVLLVFGGSRGARSINRALWQILPDLLEATQIVHITGELDWPDVERIQAELPSHLASNYHPFAYLHEEMGTALGAADLVVSRAGAATMGEFPLFGLPSILVPYPHAWRYQKVNAEHLVAKGAAVSLMDENLGDQLLPTILDLIKDRNRLQAMSVAAQRLANPDAAASIAAELLSLAQEKGGRHG